MFIPSFAECVYHELGKVHSFSKERVKALKKVIGVINSCTTDEQLACAEKMIENYKKLYSKNESNYEKSKGNEDINH